MNSIENHGTKRDLENGFTYFVRDGDVIKIGYSAHPARRINTLQSGIARPLEVLAVVGMEIADEFSLHQQFAHLRVRGEWFRAEPELIEFIESIKPHHLTATEIGAKPATIKKQPDPKMIAIRELRRDLIKKRPLLPEKAKPFASNLIEQTLNIHNEADLDRLRPFMDLQRRRLEEALSAP